MWRGLKDRPALFAQYLSLFSRATYRRVMKQALSPEVVSAVLVALRDHPSSRRMQVLGLEGLAGSSGFQLTLSLLATEDLQCVRDVFAQLEGDGGETDASKLPSVEELRKSYQLDK